MACSSSASFMWIFLGIVAFAGFFAHALWRRCSWAIGASGYREFLRTSTGLVYKLDYKENKSSGTVKLAIVCLPGISFRFHRESGFDRAAKAIGLSVERQFGEAGFDSQIYFASEAKRFGDVLQASAEVRSQLLELFEDSALKRIECYGQHIIATYSGAKDTLPPGGPVKDSASINKTVTALYALARAAEAARSITKTKWDPFATRSIILVSLSTAFLGLGILELVRIGLEKNELILDAWGLFQYSSGMSAIALVLSVVTTIFLLRGSAYAHVVLAEVLISGGAGLLMGGYVLARDVNVEWDASVARTLECRALEKHSGHRRKTGTYYKLTFSCMDGRLHFVKTKEVSADTYRRVAIDQPFELKVKNGRLGFDWIESYSFSRLDG